MNLLSNNSQSMPQQSHPGLMDQEEARQNRLRGTSSISSNELLAGARELEIIHHGERYLLRVTSKGKLILTK